MSVEVLEVRVADEPDAWRSAGFAVDGDVCVVGTVAIRLVGRGAGSGVVAWRLDGIDPGVTEVDGLATLAGGDHPPAAGDHPNGVSVIDHLVLLTPDLDRTLAALARLGLEPRRHRDGEMGGAPVRQVFYRLGPVILEVVGAPGAEGEGPSRLWGITFTVVDLDATAARLAAHVGAVKDAVQPGRRITTLRGRDLGIAVAIAFISERP